MQWIFCAACTKYNKAQLNSSYVNVFFEIYGLLKMLFCHFRKFDFSNLKSTFVRWLMKNFFRFLWRISKVLYWRLFEYFSILHKSPFSLLIIVCFAMERCNYSRVIIYMACNPLQNGRLKNFRKNLSRRVRKFWFLKGLY